jgi:plastocyanin
MRRATLLSAIVGATIAVLGAPGIALAGAGCHTGATQADETGKDGTTVRIIDACFTASITKVDPGTSVTFVNDDVGMTHNVGGTEWGYFDDMTKGDSFSATFADPGVYPFACSYHPGMTGAIVVGDGYGAGAGWTVLNDPVAPVADTAKVAPVADAGGGSSLAFVAIGVLGAALGAAITIGARRARRTGPVV